MLGAYFGMVAGFASDPNRCQRWYGRLWERLAYCARYGHTSPNDSIHWELRDLIEFNTKLSDIVKEETKKP